MTLVDSPARHSSAPLLRSGDQPSSVSAVDVAIDRARRHLLEIQAPDGHWCGELEGDSILESEYILTMCFLGRLDERKVAKAGEQLRRDRQKNGGWGPFPSSGADVNATVKAYFALKLLGDCPDSAHMQEAREVILELGGLPACNSFTKIYLAIFGQYPWSRCPAVPPELVLFPDRAPVSLYRMSSWSRAIVVPLSILWAIRPECEIPEDSRLGELQPESFSRSWPRQETLAGSMWSRFFRVAEWSVRLYSKAPLPGLRRRAIESARQWTLDHLAHSDGLGAIFPPIVNSIFALKSLGRPEDARVVDEQVGELERLEIEDDETLRVQPCFSPVWDTALALDALLDSGQDRASSELLQATEWLLDREVSRPGDWARRCPHGSIGGWFFEYANEFYPDSDDTAQVVASLTRVAPTDPGTRKRVEAALDRGTAWLLQMQNRDGGWGAFDKDCDREFLTYIPFADHNAMIDPATVDVTSRVVEALLASGMSADSPVVRRAIDFIRSRQEADGAWYGRWGCNYIYGTWLAMSALRRTGLDFADELGAGARWLTGRQNDDGGWGELPESYADSSTRGRGPSTACQTAWALLGLIAAGEGESEGVRRGVEFLLARQESPGDWTDTYWTGTGFPKVFYLNYHLYATYFPLAALAAHRDDRACRDRPALPSRVAEP